MALWAVFFSGTSFAADTSLTVLEQRVSDLVYRLSRSVVTVESSIPAADNPATGQGHESVTRLVSSGIIYDILGHIVVSAPAVIGCDEIVVRFDGQTMPAQLRGIDYQTGLAVIYVNRKIGTPATVGNQYGCAGQMVIALGNAYGVRASPSLGFCAGARPDGVIQFSAPITSETVGGGLFDLSGKLIGIVTGGIGYGRWAQAGLAVPADEISGIVRHLLIRGDRPAGYIGITTTDIEISPAIELRTQPNRMMSASTQAAPVIEKAILVTSVVPFSPAARAGLKKGDLLYSLNDRPLVSSLDLKEEVRQTRPGTIIELGFIRHNAPYQTRVEVGQLRLDAVNEFRPDPRFLSRQQLPTDSLLDEIESLKRAVLQLERRLKGLK